MDIREFVAYLEDHLAGSEVGLAVDGRSASGRVPEDQERLLPRLRDDALQQLST